MRINRWSVIWFVVLAGLSLLKDQITPDPLNTPQAAFINLEQGTDLVLNHWIFWFISLCYSAAFVYIPARIVREISGTAEAKYTLWLLFACCVIEYGILFSGIDSLRSHLLPKVNRYLHSPIPLLFFIAAFTINKRSNGSD